ncbi:Peroxiredoxin 1, partial [Grifola frondosa]
LSPDIRKVGPARQTESRRPRAVIENERELANHKAGRVASRHSCCKQITWAYIRQIRTKNARNKLDHLPAPLLPKTDLTPLSIVLDMVATVQKPAPAFKSTAVIDGTFKDISLADYLGHWYALEFCIRYMRTHRLFISRLHALPQNLSALTSAVSDFTFVCPTEILAFNDALAQFQEIDTVVLGVSTDSHFSHLAWATQPRKQGGLGPDLKLPLIADKSLQISREYGVLIEEEGVALRGLFIIDPKGTLRQITVNDLPVGRSVDETIRLVKAFQFTDKYGEVCPANWHEGSKTIKADPKGSLEYFSTTGPAETNGDSRKRARLN